MPQTPTSPARLRALYRSLLRELPPRPILARERPPLHRTLRASFCGSAPTPNTPSTPSSTPSSKEACLSSQPVRPGHVDVGLATQLLTYLRAQRTYAGLIERYNPGMGMDQDERVRLSARKVGMDLPLEFDPAGVRRR